MAQLLHVTFEVSDEVDMTREDPEDHAADLLEMHRDDMSRNGHPLLLTGVLEASWDAT